MKKSNNLIVRPSMTVKELEHEFSSLFPYLKLELFLKGGESFANKKLKEIAKSDNPMKFIIQPSMPVSEMEIAFWGNMGLQSAVYRKVGTNLIETRFTSFWSLKHQNEITSNLFNSFN